MSRWKAQPFYRQTAEKAVDVKNEQAAESVKLETAQDIQAAGVYPPARLAQAYVIWQKYGPTFSPAEALEKGTLFPELYSPYPY
ncbi:spore coat associated protein CotJA [Pelotomaculum propionicicum]|uniref:spore coat associated protein CotJA n=1 Tax=Pelotomaculum propionicicum TaxID=258475 RepID=UPI003B7FD62D